MRPETDTERLLRLALKRVTPYNRWPRIAVPWWARSMWTCDRCSRRIATTYAFLNHGQRMCVPCGFAVRGAQREENA